MLGPSLTRFPVFALLQALLVQHALCQGSTLVLMGGSMSEDNIVWEMLVEMGGGPESKVGVITAASDDPEGNGEYYTDLFERKGAGEARWIPIHENNKEANSDPEVIASIQEMTVFFFGGGQMYRVINSFYNEDEEGQREDSPALLAIRDMYYVGVPVSGTSAGMSSQPEPPMIEAGYSWEALVYGAFEHDVEDMPSRGLRYDPEGGLRLLEHFVLDSHFSERGRQARLARLLADTMEEPLGTYYALAADEDTAIVITDANTVDSVGEVLPSVTRRGGITIIDLSTAQRVVGQQCWHMVDINTIYITEGDRVNLGSGQFEVTFADWKSNLVGNENYPEAETSDDIFGYWDEGSQERPNYAHVACRLVDSPDLSTSGTSMESDPMYQVNIEQLPETEAYAGVSPNSGRSLISYRGLSVEMKAVDGQEDNSNCISTL